MPRRNTRNKRREILDRAIQVDAVAFRVSRRAEKPRGEGPRFEGGSWLEIRGNSDEPLGDVVRFVIHLHVTEGEVPGPSIPPAIGAILSLKPEVQVAIAVDPVAFDRAWSLATANLLRYCWLAFTQPFRRSSLVISASFSSELEE